ncbi:response regulator [Bradyrhizobium sp. USDA 4502]
MDAFIRLIEAVAKLVGAFAWPAVVLVIVWWFADAFKQFLSNISEGSFKAFGFEGTAKRSVQEAVVSADLTKQANEPSQIRHLPQSVGKSLSAADFAARLLLTPHHSTDRRRLLWVDDQPTNNVLEMRALEGLGFTIDMVVDTDEALNDISKVQYDAIISDSSRPGDPDAAKTLVRRLRERGSETPVIIYSSNDSEQFASEMKDTGAFAVTHRASDLVRQVAEAVAPQGFARSRIRDWITRVRHIRSSS